MANKSVKAKRTRRNLASKNIKKQRIAKKTQQAQKQAKFQSVSAYINSFLYDAHQLLCAKESLRVFLFENKQAADAAYARDPSPENEKVLPVIDELLQKLHNTDDKFVQLFHTLGKIEDTQEKAEQMTLMMENISTLVDLQSLFGAFANKAVETVTTLRGTNVEGNTFVNSEQLAEFEAAKDDDAESTEEINVNDTESMKTATGQSQVAENAANSSDDGEIELDAQDVEKAVETLRPTE